MLDLFWRRPRLLALTILLCLVAGLTALQALPRSEDPELVSRFATVFTAYPGADAERVEALVTDPLEDELREIEEIGELTSSSIAGACTMAIELADEVSAAEVDEVWSRVRDRLDDAKLEFPDGVAEPDFDDNPSDAYTLILGLSWTLDSEPSLAILGRLGEELADILRSIAGTREADVFGEPEEIVLVEVSPSKLATYGLDFDDVANALRGGDSKLPAGQLRSDRSNLLIEVAGDFESLARVDELPIRQGPEGRLLRLGEVATVRRTIENPASAIAILSGQEGVAVAARALSGRRVDLWSADARAAVAEFEESLPSGVELSTIFDQSRYTDVRLESLVQNFGLGALLVVIVIFFTMGWRSALLVGSALPLTSLLVLEGMLLVGVPIHQMSVTGLILALGLLIDNAIVMVDETRRRLDRGMEASAAIRATVRGLAGPLAGSTVTTILAFLPIVLMPGPAGEFVGTIAISVILALLSSLLLALTVTPTLAGMLLRSAKPAHSPTGKFLNNGVTSARLSRPYRKGVRLAVKYPALGVLLAIALPVFGFSRFPTLDEQFFPAADRDQFQIELRLPWQTPIEVSRAAAFRGREAILQNDAVEDVHWFVGESAPRFYYNIKDGRQGVPYYVQGLVQLKSAEGSLDVVAEIQESLDRALPELQALARPIEQGPPIDAPVELRLYGPQIQTLRELGEELRSHLAKAEGITHTRTTLEGGQPKLRLELDDAGARLVGLDETSLARRLAARTDGVLGGSLIEATEELPVRVRLEDESRKELETVTGTELNGPGGWTPVSALASVALVPETASIPHRDGRRVNTVEGYVVSGSLPDRALKDFNRILAESGWEPPFGYELQIGGEAAERDEAVGKLMAAASVLMVLMLASLVLSFDSFRFAGIIAGVAFLSVGLGGLALWLGGMPFGFMAIVGTMGLIGVAVNDSIVVLAGLRHDEGAMSGDLDACVDVVVHATRHLVSTSLTTIAGFLPLILAGGGFWPPLAWTIAGGVTGATFLSMTFVPALFLVVRRWKLRGERRRAIAAPA
ncbi:MAG: efflux RND transporter permease subunit [Planctomycetota bacterium]